MEFSLLLWLPKQALGHSCVVDCWGRPQRGMGVEFQSNLPSVISPPCLNLMNAPGEKTPSPSISQNKLGQVGKKLGGFVSWLPALGTEDVPELPTS